VFSRWEVLPRPCSHADVERWVRDYFAFLDVHGAFIFSATSTPGDEEVRAAASRMTMRACFLLGIGLRTRQRTPTDTPEALGLVVQAMLDRTWYQCRAQQLPVSIDDAVSIAAAILTGMLAADALTPP
jgi:hypothetical protein